MSDGLSSKPSFFERFVPILILISVALAFMVGVLWQKVNTLEKGDTTNTNTNAVGTAPTNDIPNGKLTAEQAKRVPAATDNDHIKGSKDAAVIIIEYSDLQCPFCEKFHPTMQQALNEYGNKIAWVYRQFPLTSIHPRALPSANASECVAALAGGDAFWKFIDTIFSNQDKYLTDDGLAEAAVLSGAKKDDFASCYSAKKYQSVVDAQQKGAEAAGITGTPGSFIINKKGDTWLVPGAVGYESLKASIEEALK